MKSSVATYPKKNLEEEEEIEKARAARLSANSVTVTSPKKGRGKQTFNMNHESPPQKKRMTIVL